VCDDGKDACGACLGEVLCGERQCAACVGHVVDKDGHFVFDGADEDHARHLIRLLAFFVEDGEIGADAVGDGCCAAIMMTWGQHARGVVEEHYIPFRATGIGRNDHDIIVLEMRADVPDRAGLGEQL